MSNSVAVLPILTDWKTFGEAKISVKDISLGRNHLPALVFDYEELKSQKTKAVPKYRIEREDYEAYLKDADFQDSKTITRKI